MSSKATKNKFEIKIEDFWVTELQQEVYFFLCESWGIRKRFYRQRNRNQSSGDWKIQKFQKKLQKVLIGSHGVLLWFDGATLSRNSVSKNDMFENPVKFQRY